MNKIRTIIVDDEPDSILLLQLQLQKHCPQVEVMDTATNSAQALQLVEKYQPDLLLLDIEMPGMNGFELLEKLAPFVFSLIFITAYNQFALKAFRVNALDYLLKPVEAELLVEAISKLPGKKLTTAEQLNGLKEQLQGRPITRIAIPMHGAVQFIELAQIAYVESNSNYSKIVMQDKQQYIVAKTLKGVQEVLEESHFLRVHRQYVVNLNLVKHFYRGENMYLVLNDGTNIPVGRNQKEKFEERFGWL